MLRRVLVFAAAAAVFCLPASSQTVDEIIAKYYAARGGADKIKALQSVRMTGRFVAGAGVEAPFTLELKRTNMMRLEFVVQGLTAVQAYDGKTGWAIIPFMGKKDPEPMSAEDLKDAEENADMDGPLMDYKAKGNQVELLGKEKVEGTDCYKLKLTLKNGNIHTLYLDTDSFLEIKDISKRIVRGAEVELENTSGDYKEVGGLIFPFALEQGARGSDQKQRIIVEKIELNPTLDDDRFKMPAPKPPETKPGEQKP